jgi:hypothetical protein
LKQEADLGASPPRTNQVRARRGPGFPLVSFAARSAKRIPLQSLALGKTEKGKDKERRIEACETTNRVVSQASILQLSNNFR